jgi:LysM repeat protein
MTNSVSAPLRFVVLLTSLAVALLLLLTGPVAARTDDLDSEIVTVTYVEHQVSEGDTLWGIAAGYTLPGDDVRVSIHEIRAANGLPNSEIYVGQVLVVPVEF